MSPLYGLGNVGLALGIATVGLILGLLACRYRRLGPGMWTHAFFNAMSVLALLAAR
jgi:membrane protease YdiL (CAAX protease family)